MRLWPIFLVGVLAAAEVVNVPVVAFGMYYSGGTHDPASKVYRVGYASEEYVCDRNYVAFDLTNVAEVANCTLAFARNGFSSDPPPSSCLLKFVTVGLPVDYVAQQRPAGPEGVAIWGNLAGNGLAMATAPGGTTAPFQVAVTADGITALNEGRGSQVLWGGALGSCECRAYMFDANGDLPSPISLTCLVASPSVTPSASPSHSRSPSFSRSRSETASETPTNSVTSSETPSLTPSPSDTATVSTTPSASSAVDAPSSSVTSTPTTSPTVSHSPNPDEALPPTGPTPEPSAPALSIPAIAGIAAAGVVVVGAAIAVIVWRVVRARRRGYQEVQGGGEAASGGEVVAMQ